LLNLKIFLFLEGNAKVPGYCRLLPFKTGMANRAEEFILLSLIISYTAQATSKNEVITTMMMALNIITLIGIVALLILNFVMAIRATCCTSDKEQEEEEEEEKEDNAVEIKKNS
jgi:beta-lactamase regulating signal transducer with metallopeptidase domain